MHEVAFDVTDADAVAAGIADRGAGGPARHLVNNAGIQRRAPLLEFTLQDWNRLLATNLTSAFLVGREVARGMVAARQRQDHQHRVGAERSWPGPASRPYAATKGGDRRCSPKGMCADLGPARDLQVNALGSRLLRDRTHRALVDDEAFHPWVRGRTPAGALGQGRRPRRRAGVPGLPASDFVNGQVALRRRRHARRAVGAPANAGPHAVDDRDRFSRGESRRRRIPARTRRCPRIRETALPCADDDRQREGLVAVDGRRSGRRRVARRRLDVTARRSCDRYAGARDGAPSPRACS